MSGKVLPQIEKLNRDLLYDKVLHKFDEITQEAEERKIEVYDLIERMSPTKDAGDPETALGHILYRENLQADCTPSVPSSSLAEFDRNPATRAAFWMVCDKDYDNVLGITAPVERAGTNTQTQIDPNSTFRPQPSTGLYERNKFSPKITIADIATGVETITGTDFKQPEYTTPVANETSREIPEASPIQTTTISFADVPGKTKKFGGGLRWSDEFALEAVNLELIRIYMRRHAARDVNKLVREGLSAMVAQAGSSAHISLGSGDFDIDDLLELALFDGPNNNDDENGYMLTSIFATKDVVKRIIKANATVDNPGAYSQYPQDRFGNLWNPIQLGNSGLGGPTLVWMIRTGVTGLSNSVTLGIDNRYAATLMRTARATVVEDQRIAKEQVTERYMTQRAGWRMTDPDASFRIGT